MDHFVYGLNQCNVVSHCLSLFTELSMDDEQCSLPLVFSSATNDLDPRSGTDGLAKRKHFIQIETKIDS